MDCRSLFLLVNILRNLFLSCSWLIENLTQLLIHQMSNCKIICGLRETGNEVLLVIQSFLGYDICSILTWRCRRRKWMWSASILPPLGFLGCENQENSMSFHPCLWDQTEKTINYILEGVHSLKYFPPNTLHPISVSSNFQIDDCWMTTSSKSSNFKLLVWYII